CALRTSAFSASPCELMTPRLRVSGEGRREGGGSVALGSRRAPQRFLEHLLPLFEALEADDRLLLAGEEGGCAADAGARGEDHVLEDEWGDEVGGDAGAERGLGHAALARVRDECGDRDRQCGPLVLMREQAVVQGLEVAGERAGAERGVGGGPGVLVRGERQVDEVPPHLAGADVGAVQARERIPPEPRAV